MRRCAAHFEALPEGSLVVDVGCGGGQMVRALERAAYRAIGVDVDRSALPSGGAGRFIAADGERLPIRTASVDGVFVFSAFQYMSRGAALAECSRVLKKGGLFAIVENLSGNPVAKIERLRRKMSAPSLAPQLTPRTHLAWRDRSLYEQFFTDVRYEAHHVLAPAFLLSNALAPGDERRWVAKSLRALQRLERAVLELPYAAAVAWHAVIYGRK
jgi:ubiquinone/menaquinone biosynthesis C-methylase UbiE